MTTNSSINKNIAEILNIYREEHMTSFIQIAWEIGELYNIDDEKDWVEDEVGVDDVLAVRVARTAYLLSKLASIHGPLLAKINQKCPLFWKKMQEKVTHVD